MRITAIILAKNEDKKIEKAVKSLLFCDEVLVIDDESTDRTKELAEKAGANVLRHSKKSEFAGQRNWAMQQAKNEWILFVDADEEVSEELKKDILVLLSTNYQLPTTNSFAIPRRDFFWGHELRYGETKKARTVGIIRLMKKGSGVWTGVVHETFIPTGEVSKLNGFLNHFSHDSVSQFIHDINTYSSLRADELFSHGKTTNWIELIVFPFAKFIYTYFLLGGFLDGAPGFVYSFVMSFHSFLVRAKLLTKKYD
jgi:glycosyltransferase involved in cell wall biosynthesis